MELVHDFLKRAFSGSLHAKRILSLANGTLGVLTGASLAVSVIGHALAQARGLARATLNHAIEGQERRRIVARRLWKFGDESVAPHDPAQGAVQGHSRRGLAKPLARGARLEQYNSATHRAPPDRPVRSLARAGSPIMAPSRVKLMRTVT
jgi:hypothetical protein